jgi:hypothetical protein
MSPLDGIVEARTSGGLVPTSRGIAGFIVCAPRPFLKQSARQPRSRFRHKHDARAHRFESVPSREIFRALGKISLINRRRFEPKAA